MEDELSVESNEVEIAPIDNSYPTGDALLDEYPELDDDGSDLAPDEDKQEDQIDHNVEEKTIAELLEEAKEMEDSTQETEEAPKEGDIDTLVKRTLKRGEEFQQFDLRKEEDAKQYDELAQKGYDYTQKTQALSEDRKAFEKEREEVTALNEEKITALEKNYAEFNETLQNYNLFDHVMQDLQESDPDIFELIQERAQTVVKAANTPYNKA